MCRGADPKIEDKPCIAVLMTTHNRKVKTLACLGSLYASFGLNAKFKIMVFMVDDGSTDGTAEVVRENFPEVTVIEGNGTLYWAGGMSLAEKQAENHQPDYFLWLNDDVVLLQDALLKALFEASTLEMNAILAGATCSSKNQEEITYSGSRLKNFRPTSLYMVSPDMSKSIEIDAFNGNFVLVPRHIQEKIGSIDGHFEHAYADIDYGLRARRANVPIRLLHGVVGTCEINPLTDTWQDSLLPVRMRIRILFGKKALPLRSHFRFNTRHAGILGIMFAFASYARAIFQIFRSARQANLGKR